MTVLRRVAGLLAAAGLTLAIGKLSYFPVQLGGSDSAMVRLAWRATPARIRHCRPLSPEELAKIPVHMRRTEQCEEQTLPYTLTVRLDSAAPAVLPIHAAGARQDRPMYVFHQEALAAGPHRLTVRFERAAAPEGVDAPVSQTPPLLTFDSVLVLRPRQIALLTYDADRQRLVLEPAGQP